MATENTSTETVSPPSGEFNAEELLNFDPFAKSGEEEQATAVEAAAVAPTEAAPTPAAVEEGKPAEAVAEAVAPEAAPPAPAEDPAMVALRQQNELLTQTLKTVQEAQAPAQAPAEAPAEAPAADIPAYSFNIPDELVKHIQSDDPAEVRTGVAALAQGVAQTVHQTVMQQFGEQMSQFVPNYVQQSVASMQQQQEVFNDFYGNNKDLNVPELRPLVVSVAQQVASETGADSWSPTLRDAVATRVRGMLRSGAAPAASTPPQPANFGGSARPAADAAATPVQADVMTTLFG